MPAAIHHGPSASKGPAHAGANTMKVYVLTTGALFGLLTVAHLWRMIVERDRVVDPWYILITVAAGALCVWAWLLYRRTTRS